MTLTWILGTESNVRIIRALVESPTPISPAELSRRAQIQRSSVHRALRVLSRTGIITIVGPAASPRIALDDHSPLKEPLCALFRTEQSRFDEILAGLRDAATRLEPPPIAVWVEGRVARGVDQPGDPIIVCVVDDAHESNRPTHVFREVERRFAVRVDVRARPLSDLEEPIIDAGDELQYAIPILGVPPMALAARHRSQWVKRNIGLSETRDARSHALGRSIADRLALDPSIVAEAHARIQDRWSHASPSERKELDEWRRILATETAARLRAILTAPGERATRLRQILAFGPGARDTSSNRQEM